jgi:hypothetical protein
MQTESQPAEADNPIIIAGQASALDENLVTVIIESGRL